MNTPSGFRNIARLLVASALSVLLSAAGARAAQNVVRPEYRNPTPTNSSPRELGVICFPGNLVGPHTSPAEIPSGGGYQLRESSLGQPFAPYIPRMSTNEISQPYAAEVTAVVLGRLYPAAGSSKAAVEASAAAFRYQWLLYAPNTTNGETRTVADFDGISRWFGNAERVLVNQQIAILMDALAVCPWDTTLRRTLLDCYTDRAIAELQYNKSDLVALGKKRLGLTLTGQFIVDDEITLISNVVARLQDVLNQYQQLFACANDGVEPADFDTRFPLGTPFGYYIFATEQPARNTEAAQFFNTNGTLTRIPDFDPVLKEIPRNLTPEPFVDANGNGFFDAGENFTDLNANGIYDSGSVIFSGYKDYTTLLQVLGEYVQRSAEWAKYLGMRRGPGDLTRARGIITDLQKKTATDYALLRNLFGGVAFPPGDASGVNAALGAVERAFADSVNTRSFLQGSGNTLGLDNNFMVFLQDGSGINDTYALLKPLVYDDLHPGASAPVNRALLEQAAARTAYENFRASVDKVVQELSDVQQTFADRFEAITGYTLAEIAQFDGLNHKPDVASELATVNRSFESLKRRKDSLSAKLDQLFKDLEGATNAITLAEGVSTSINSARQIYLGISGSAWDTISTWQQAAAGAQATADAVYAGTSSLIAAGAAAVAGPINAGVQIQAAERQAQAQQSLDAASIGFQTELAKANVSLTAQQSKLQLGSIQRELLAIRIELEENSTAVAQSLADKTRLLREVESIRQNFDSNQQAIRGRFYADPIHLVRSDNAILRADAAFANAQRWMFYLLRALEYKWNQNFVGVYANRNYDAGSIFKLRNAEELKDLFNALVNFDTSGRLGYSYNPDQIDVISVRKLLVPNPNALNPINSADPGARVDNFTGETVSEREMFRRQLRRLVDANGSLVIPINTTALSPIDYPSLFTGPQYATNGQILSAGRWHDVVRYVKVNIVSPSQPPANVAGKVTYSGLSLFRTRVAPCGLPANHFQNALDPGGRDVPGELISKPFRSYFQPDFTVPLFEVTDRMEESGIPFARTQSSVGLGDPLAAQYKFNQFAEYSVAATGWQLTILPTGMPNVNLDLVEDIEFIVAHRSANRIAMPTCP
jgi:Skp family chaperone for outer membrane proteins